MHKIPLAAAAAAVVPQLARPAGAPLLLLLPLLWCFNHSIYIYIYSKNFFVKDVEIGINMFTYTELFIDSHRNTKNNNL